MLFIIKSTSYQSACVSDRSKRLYFILDIVKPLRFVLFISYGEDLIESRFHNNILMLYMHICIPLQ